MLGKKSNVQSEKGITSGNQRPKNLKNLML